ncbi:MAG: DUF3460 family protein [Burkholderiales bacterium]|nr:DUF3460 family protein [Burkholderiales bacterium]
MAANKKYVSEIDNFITNFIQQNPEIKQKQKILRQTWWDQDFIDQDEMLEYKNSSAPRPAYSYFEYTNNGK